MKPRVICLKAFLRSLESPIKDNLAPLNGKGDKSIEAFRKSIKEFNQKQVNIFKGKVK